MSTLLLLLQCGMLSSATMDVYRTTDIDQLEFQSLKAYVLTLEENFDEAEAILLGLPVQNNLVFYWLALGRSLESRQRFVEASEIYMRLHDRKADIYSPYVLHEMSMYGAAKAGIEPTEYLSDVLAQYPTFQPAIIDYLNSLQYEMQPDRIISHIIPAIKSDNDCLHWRLCWWMAYAYYMKSDGKAAATWIDRAIEQFRDVSNLILYGSILMDLFNDRPKASPYYLEAIENAPLDIAAYEGALMTLYGRDSTLYEDTKRAYFELFGNSQVVDHWCFRMFIHLIEADYVQAMYELENMPEEAGTRAQKSVCRLVKYSREKTLTKSDVERFYTQSAEAGKIADLVWLITHLKDKEGGS